MAAIGERLPIVFPMHLRTRKMMDVFGLEQGTNVVIGNDKNCILAAANDVLEGQVVRGRVPEKWDGKAADQQLIVRNFRTIGQSISDRLGLYSLRYPRVHARLPEVRQAVVECVGG